MSATVSQADVIRMLRRQRDRLASMIDWPSEDKMERASGNAVCESCGLTYFDHPHEEGLTLTCDGRLWKL